MRLFPLTCILTLSEDAPLGEPEGSRALTEHANAFLKTLHNKVEITKQLRRRLKKMMLPAR
jgi:hypothetical protein